MHADYYNGFYQELSRIDAQGNSFSKIEGLLPPLRPGARILDIGCGHGTTSAELVQRGHHVFGMEINQDALAALKAKGITPIAHDITAPFELEEAFDVVLLLDVLEHVFDPAALLGEATRVLAPGGHILVTVPLYFDLLDRLRILFTGSIVSYDNRCYGDALYRRFRSYNYDHIRFFRPKDLYELCALHALQVEAVHYKPMVAFNPIAKQLVRLFANRYTVGLNPDLLAHSMALRVTR